MSSKGSVKSHTHKDTHDRKKHKRDHIFPPPILICCEVLPGLKPFAEKELLDRFGEHVTLLPNTMPKTLFISYSGELPALFSLRTVVAVYLILSFAISRPRALLGHQHYHALLQSIHNVRALHPTQAFTSIRISAAGDNSSVFLTLKEQIEKDTGLIVDNEDADLLVRIRPASLAPEGWEVMIRLTPRPLSARPWRVFNMKGALNATIAAAIVRMTKPHTQDRFLNMMCGSGTLLIERLQQGPASLVVGCDMSEEALSGARQNLGQAHLLDRAKLYHADATQLPFADRSFNIICTDVPWGHQVGSHQHNQHLYPQLLLEAARLATPGALFFLITHEITLFEAIIPTYTTLWLLQEVIKVSQGGLHPRIYVFRRNDFI